MLEGILIRDGGRIVPVVAREIVHRSPLVNLDFVETIEPFDNSQLLVRMKDGTKITGSRTASKRLRDWAV